MTSEQKQSECPRCHSKVSPQPWIQHTGWGPRSLPVRIYICKKCKLVFLEVVEELLK